MSFYSDIQALYHLVNTFAVLFAMVLDYLMLAQARRKRLPAFLRWLVPATAAATLGLALSLLMDAMFVLRPRLYGVYTLTLLSLWQYGLAVAAGLLSAMSVFRLWRLVSEMPADAEAAPPPTQAGGQTDVWPPPPTGAG